MRDWWLAYRWKVVVGAGAVVGTVLLVVVLLAVLAISGVWGPGWLHDLIDAVRG